MDEFTAEPGERGALTVSGAPHGPIARKRRQRACVCCKRVLMCWSTDSRPLCFGPAPEGQESCRRSARGRLESPMDTKPGTEASATKEPQAKGTHEALPIGQIITDARTQVRAAIDEAIVEEYAEHLRAGGSLPPVTAFRDEASRTYLADGFHRVRAHERPVVGPLDEVRIRTRCRLGDTCALVRSASSPTPRSGLSAYLRHLAAQRVRAADAPDDPNQDQSDGHDSDDRLRGRHLAGLSSSPITAVPLPGSLAADGRIAAREVPRRPYPRLRRRRFAGAAGLQPSLPTTSKRALDGPSCGDRAALVDAWRSSVVGCRAWRCRKAPGGQR